MDDNRKMIDSRYVENNDMRTIEENEKFKQNENLVNNLNSVNNNIAHSPNTNLHKNPLPNSSGLSNLNDDTNLKNHTSNISSVNDKGNPRNVELRNNAIKNSNLERNKSLKNRIARAGLRVAGVPNSAVNALENARSKSEVQKKKGLLGNLFNPLLGGGKSKEQVEEKANDGGGTFRISARMKRVALVSTLAPLLMFFLLLFVSLFVIYAALDKYGIPADKVLDTATEVIEKKLDNSSDSDVEDAGDKAINSSGDNVLKSNVTFINNSNSIYSIKLGNINVLAKTDATDTGSDFDFDINMVSELYPPSSDYANVDYSAAFFYKLVKLNDYYKSKCGKQVLDIPLLIITLKQESDDMATVFASNLGYIPKYELSTKKIDQNFGQYYDYYYNWSDYQFSRNNSIHDMEILAQHMVEIRGTNYCVYSEEKYNEFLKEFIEKKYYLGNDNSSFNTYGMSSSNYFPRYNLTEDQLLQIASLCAQEQGHTNPVGAAAEASLMANKFELSGSSYLKQYSNSADALYHYVREVKWWAKAGYFMDKRDAKPEIVAAVRDVLINGNRTLPRYVNSHDCPNCGTDKCPNGKRGDICSVETNGITYTDASGVANRSNYVSHRTIVSNVYGGRAIFYAFPSTAGDPFSYKDSKLREKYGDCHYDPTQKTFVDCMDFTDVFVEWLIGIANDDTHGYSQIDRNSLIDFDCSSLVYYGLLNSGFNTGELGSTAFTTRNEQDILKRQGFKEIKINSDLSQLKKGDILWKNGHTEVYIGEGMTVGAHSASNGGTSDGERGDQNGKEISVVSIMPGNYWEYAYRYER